MEEEVKSNFLKEHKDLPFILKSISLVFAIIFFCLYIITLPIPIPFSSYIPLILSVIFFVLSFPKLEDDIFSKLEKIKFPKKIIKNLKILLKNIRRKLESINDKN